MREINYLKLDSVTAIRIRIPGLLQATPFSEYLTLLPMIPLHFGPGFPAHFEKFCAYVALWRYGGKYISLHPKAISDSRENGCQSDALDIDQPPIGERFVVHSNEIEAILLRFLNNAKLVLRDENMPQAELTNMSRLEIVSVEKPPRLATPAFDNRLTQHYGLLHNSIAPERNDFSLEVAGLSAMQYLPFVDVFIDKETWSLSGPCMFQRNHGIKVWSYYSRVTFFLDRIRMSGRARWPPTDELNPLLLSMENDHMRSQNISSGVGIEYIKNHGAAGMLDMSTKSALVAQDVVAYTSAGSSVLLNRHFDRRTTERKEILIVGIAPGFLHTIFPTTVLKSAMYVETVVPKEFGNNAKRFSKASAVLDKLAAAKLVITSDLHWALPCAGMNTPVIFVRTGNSTHPPSQHIAFDMFHTVDFPITARSSKLVASFSWDKPPRNPKPEILYRLQASAWEHIRRDVSLRETARTFGTVPLPEKNSTGKLRFFQVYTTSSMNIRNRRSLESILYHHPESAVTLFSNTLDPEEISYFVELGYVVRIVPYTLTDLLTQAIDSERGAIKMYAAAFARRLPLVSTGEYWYSHETDLIRLLILYIEGGVYLDTDVIVLRNMNSLKNVLATQEDDYSTLNGAVLAFEAKNIFLLECIREFVMAYNGNSWAENGPELLTRVASRGSLACKNTDPEPIVQTDCHVSLLKKGYFYPLGWSEVESACFVETDPKATNATLKFINEMSYAIHLNNRVTSQHQRTVPGTVCRNVLNRFCIACSSMV
jgi:Alpha 1,4-glycosyltransferase conserved region/Glycosyltransferase sugar-binding region containing DXD motif